MNGDIIYKMVLTFMGFSEERIFKIERLIKRPKYKEIVFMKWRNRKKN